MMVGIFETSAEAWDAHDKIKLVRPVWPEYNISTRTLGEYTLPEKY